MEYFNKVKVTAAPHVRSTNSVSRVMTNVIIALIPALAVGVYYFGLYSLIVVMVCIISAVGFEALTQVLLKRKVSVSDMSAVLTGLLLGMNLPPTVPLWLPVIGAGFAVIIVKQLFGGLGQNFMNPALGARAFLLASWPALMTKFSPAVAGSWASIAVPDALSGASAAGADAITGATPLVALASGTNLPGLWNTFIGNVSGVIGEASALALLLGGVYLLIRKVISWHVPVTYIGTVAILTYLLGPNNFSLMTVGYHVFGGGLMLGAIFMATDYSSAPIDRKAQVVYGIGCGVLTAVFRLYGPSAEGVSYAILIMNLAVPLLDKAFKPRLYGEVKAK